MDLSEDEIALLEGYAQGTLTDSEEEYVGQQLRIHQQWREALQMIKDLESVLEHQEAVRLKSVLQSDTKRAASGNFQWIAAAVLLLVLSGVYYFLQSRPDYEALYAANYIIYPNIEEPQVRGDQSSDSAFVYYENAMFYKALAHFEDQQNDAAYFYTGQCYLALERYEEALDAFGKVDKDEPVYGAVATYYQALTAIRLREPELASELLRSIENREDYSRKVRRILQALE